MFTTALFGLRFAIVAIIGVLAVSALHRLWFIWIPSRLLKEGRSARWKLRWLELIAATPSLLGDSLKIVARTRLLGPYLLMGRHAEVVRLARAILSHDLNSAELESDIRLRLADSLEALGERSAADTERKNAAACLGGADESSFGYTNLAKMLSRQNRHAEAFDMLERALELVPQGQQAIRLEILSKLAVTGFNAARLDDAARWAEIGLREGATGSVRKTLHRMAGACHNDQGRVDEAEAHKRAALEMAEADGDPKAISECLADVAEMLRKRGKLADALAAAEQAASVAPQACRQARMVQYETLKAAGDFHAALGALDQASLAKKHEIPAYERRSQAIVHLGRAWLLIELKQPEHARTQLEAARREFESDARLGLWCAATDAWLAALEGNQDEYNRRVEETEAALVDLADDRNSVTGALSSLGKGACLIHDFERGLDWWKRYLEFKLDLVNLPSGHYHLGLCLEGLGREFEARTAWRQALDLGVDTHYSRLAASRLRSLTPRSLT
jgi:tetratricopeptide (TPR) repeat protein